MTAVDQLVRQPGAWLVSQGHADIAISSRVRLARNIEGQPFPGWAKDEARLRLWSSLVPALRETQGLADGVVVGMEELGAVDRQVLRERHLISTELAEKERGSGVVFAPDETVSAMVNEEDHLRLQTMRPGMDVVALWREVDALDSEIESRTDYAFSPRLGYLTACPSNVGTGLRASVMLHLPGLRFIGEIDPVVKGLNKVGLAVRGLLGEGTEAFGNMFQISNQTTLGEPEEVIVKRLVQIVSEVIEHERNARTRLLEEREAHVRDRVGRAYGILSQAHVLPSGEALDWLSALRLGVELGMVRNLSVGTVNEVMLLTQPGHLQKMMLKELEPLERDLVRARLIREKMRDVALSEESERK